MLLEEGCHGMYIDSRADQARRHTIHLSNPRNLIRLETTVPHTIFFSSLIALLGMRNYAE